MSLACGGASFSYEEARAPIPALCDVSFELRAGGSLALMGASKPRITWSSVDLPEPDAPISARERPARSSNETSHNAGIGALASS